MAPVPDITIQIAYDQQIVAEGIAAVLAKDKRFLFTGMEQIDYTRIANEKLAADFLVFEFCDISICQIDYIQHIRNYNPQLKILVVTSPLLRKTMLKLMYLINGLVIRSCSAIKIIRAIYEIEETGKYLSPKAVRALFEEEANGDMVKNDLTPREKEILSSWLTCHDVTEISEKLHISTTTVRTHLRNIREKFGCANQIRMMAYACKENLLSETFKPICPNCRYHN